jgi:hypothetical protein
LQGARLQGARFHVVLRKKNMSVCNGSHFFLRGVKKMEWGTSIFVIAVFLVLAGHVTASVGVRNIQDNWPENRCNPMYMPFASTLAPTPTTASENFSYCIHDFMMSAAPSFTKPLSYVQAMTLELVSSMTTSNEKSVEQTSRFSFSVSGLFKSLFGVMASIAGQFNVLISKLTDAQGKMMGAMTALLYIVTATQYAFMSMWEGIPGSMIRSFGDMNADNKNGKKGKKKKK